MKILNYVLLLSFMFLLIGSCSKLDTQPNTLNSNDDGTLKSTSEYIPGTDITVQLRNDLNAGLDVNLSAGHFFVSESIIVQGFSGTVKGAGKNATTIEASQGYKAMENPMFGPEFMLTEIFAFYQSKGDVTFKDMTILVTGDAPAEEHNNPFLGMLTTIDNAIVVAGVHEEAAGGITVTFKNLKIKGEDSTDPLSHNGKNLIYPLIATGWLGTPKPVSIVIKDCEIEGSGDHAVEYFNSYGGLGMMKDNDISDSHAGIWLGVGNPPCVVTVKNNSFNNITSDALFKHWSIVDYCIKDNTLDGEPMPDDCQ